MTVRPTRPQASAHSPIFASALAAFVCLCLTSVGAAADNLKVTATIKPIHGLVAQVMTGVGTPQLLVRGAASPHTYALKPSDARALHQADVLFRVSETVEPFLARIVAALPQRVRVVTLAESPGIELLTIRTGQTFEAHSHPHAGEHGDDGEHGHPHRTPSRVHTAHEIDGHVWLDPHNARKMLKEIARVLSEAAPAHAEIFQANAARAEASLETLESELSRDIASIKGKPYVVFHDAYQYFERRFGLSPVGSITLSPEVRPSAKRLTGIRRRLATLEASCVFAEPQFQPRLVDAVTEGTTARAGTLDPEGALVEPGPAAYETLLRNLATGFKSCLATQS